MRLLRGMLLLAALLALAACATTMDRNNALRETQYAWSAAIRWGDFEGAWNLVDPALRKAHPMTELEFARYKQIQISGYNELGERIGEADAQREVLIHVVNRNTLVERQTRYSERWRYDPETKTWWNTSGLPDLWQAD